MANSTIIHKQMKMTEKSTVGAPDQWSFLCGIHYKLKHSTVKHHASIIIKKIVLQNDDVQEFKSLVEEEKKLSLNCVVAEELVLYCLPEGHSLNMMA